MGSAARTPKVDAALADAEVRISQHIVNQRLIPTPMEPRGSIGRYDPGTGDYTLWVTSRRRTSMRLLIAAFVLGVPEQKIRAISPDIGGGFGCKIFFYYDMPLTLAMSKKLGGRPVKFFEDRSENYSDDHPRPRSHHRCRDRRDARTASITALKVKTCANLGAYFSTIAAGIPTTLYGRMVAGCYKIPNIRVDVTGVYTNTAMVDAYRGAGRPEAAYVIERVCDSSRTRPGSIRPRCGGGISSSQAISRTTPASACCRTTAAITSRHSTRRCEQVGYAGAARTSRAARSQRASTKLLGIGLSSYVEVCGVAPSKWIGLAGEGWGAGLWESANVTRPPDRQGRRDHGVAAARPGTRDDLCATRLRRARRTV